MGHSGGSTSTPGDARGSLFCSKDAGAGTTEQDISFEENGSIPRRVLGKRRGDQLDSGDRSEKKGVLRGGIKKLFFFGLSVKN